MFAIIAPYALAMALVGLLESLMTAKLVDDITDTRSSKTRESWGQGVANVLSGLFGGMVGCTMIGQTMINVKASGVRTRISTFLAGVFLLVLEDVDSAVDDQAVIPHVARLMAMERVRNMQLRRPAITSIHREGVGVVALPLGRRPLGKRVVDPEAGHGDDDIFLGGHGADKIEVDGRELTVTEGTNQRPVVSAGLEGAGLDGGLGGAAGDRLLHLVADDFKPKRASEQSRPVHRPRVHHGRWRGSCLD
jgi:hypothetical protein